MCLFDGRFETLAQNLKDVRTVGDPRVFAATENGPELGASHATHWVACHGDSPKRHQPL